MTAVGLKKKLASVICTHHLMAMSNLGWEGKQIGREGDTATLQRIECGGKLGTLR